MCLNGLYTFRLTLEYTLKNLHFRGAQINRIEYSKVKKIMTIVSMYSRVRLKKLLGSISKSEKRIKRLNTIFFELMTSNKKAEKWVFGLIVRDKDYSHFGRCLVFRHTWDAKNWWRVKIMDHNRVVVLILVLNVPNFCLNDELSSTMNWVGCFLTDSELFMFGENRQILLKISVIPIFLTFMYLVALNLLVNNQLNSSLNSTHR